MAQIFYDRHETLAGVSGANPLLIPRNFCASAINRWFRYDENANRLPFRSLNLTFESDEVRIWFQGGNVQGASFYNSYPSFLKSSILVSIAGRIFRIQVKGNEGYVTSIATGNDPVLTHCWFTQGFEWMVIQDGVSPPILWDGVNKTRRAGTNEVPTGSVMSFIHGRLVVSSADGTNQIAVGDIVYGHNQTNTSDILNFTEIQYWAEGGAFGAPIYVGDITGMFAMPYLDTGTGQNELVILGTEGGVSLDLSRPREQWLDTQLLRISLIGGGCVSSHSLCALNGDLFFRSAEGIRSFRNARAEFGQSWKQSPISTDVRRWLDYDRPDLLQYANQVAWNNLLIGTCSPQQEGPNNLYAGWHRFHRGMVVMDAQPESNTVREGAPIWQGMWTGIRPTALVEGRIEDDHRCFAFSYDQDGKNRIYELCPYGFDTFDGQKRKMFSGYDTSAFGTIERTTNNFDLKTLQGGEMEFKEVKEKVNFTLAVKPDDSPCYIQHHEGSVGCDCVPRDCFLPTLPSQARVIFGGLEGKCDPSTNLPISKVHHWQVRVRMEGDVKVQGLAYRFVVNDHPTNCGTTGGTCSRIDCCSEADAFTYHLAPEGDNTESPDIPIPSDVIPVYNSTQQFTARCPFGFIGNPVTITATASSNISQADADLLAIAKAQNAATAQIICQGCTPGVVFTFTVNNSEEDLTAIFEAQRLQLAGKPWRIIDQHSEALYATGVFDTGGHMDTTYALQTGDTTFNPVTHIFADTSGTLVPVAIQYACPGQVSAWPDIDSY
jgi:hypothetical protein